MVHALLRFFPGKPGEPVLVKVVVHVGRQGKTVPVDDRLFVRPFRLLQQDLILLVLFETDLWNQPVVLLEGGSFGRDFFQRIRAGR